MDNSVEITPAPPFVINIVQGVEDTGGFSVLAGTTSFVVNVVASVGSVGGGGAQVLDDLSDVNISSPVDKDVIGYDGGSSRFVNYALTTAKITNIDENALVDGALLVYDGPSSKYIATSTLDNSNTIILGGTF